MSDYDAPVAVISEVPGGKTILFTLMNLDA